MLLPFSPLRMIGSLAGFSAAAFLFVIRRNQAAVYMLLSLYKFFGLGFVNRRSTFITVILAPRPLLY